MQPYIFKWMRQRLICLGRVTIGNSLSYFRNSCLCLIFQTTIFHVRNIIKIWNGPPKNLLFIHLIILMINLKSSSYSLAVFNIGKNYPSFKLFLFLKINCFDQMWIYMCVLRFLELHNSNNDKKTKNNAHILKTLSTLNESITTKSLRYVNKCILQFENSFICFCFLLRR